MNQNNNAITASSFVNLNLWSERTFYKVLHALREYNKEQASLSGMLPAGEMLDFEWKLPTFDINEQRWINIEPESRGVTVLLTWLLA